MGVRQTNSSGRSTIASKWECQSEGINSRIPLCAFASSVPLKDGALMCRLISRRFTSDERVLFVPGCQRNF